MKRFILVAVCFVISCSGIAQRAENFKTLIKQTNDHFSIYETLSPSGGSCYTYRQLGVTAEEGQQLIKEYYGEDVTTLTWLDDSLACEDLAIQIVQSKIEANIYKIIAHKDFSKYDITTLLTSDGLNIVKSEDNMLYNFSFDAKNGGTYRMQISIMHYTGYDQKKKDNSSTSSDKGNAADFNFADNGYNHIYTLFTKEGTKYLLTGSVRGCSQCFGSHVTLIAFKNNAFVQEFYYEIELRDYESGIEYDPETKTISVNYKTDDLTPDCVCGTESENEEAHEAVPEGNQQGIVDEVVLETEQEVMDEEAGEPISRQCSCTFVFDGKTFQLKSKQSLIIDTEDE